MDSTQQIPDQHRFFTSMFEPVGSASVVFFRLAFGATMLWHVAQYFSLGAISADYIDPPFHFTWYWFDWVRPIGGPGMYLVFYSMGLAAFGILTGLHYRFCTFVLLVLFTYQFLIDQAYYLNHYYLTSLIAGILVVIPANRRLAADCQMRPAIKSKTVPRWSLWLLRFQIGIPYFFGGLAKFEPDWLQCQPMTMALAQRANRFPYLGQFFTEDWVVWGFNYGGLLFDLLIVPLLMWRRTRVLAYCIAVSFHLLNSVLFDIGYFPWFMILATTIFFEPDWPDRLIGRIRRLFGVTGRNLAQPTNASTPGISPRRKLWLCVLTAFVLLQVVIPLRHYCYPGMVSWTEEGHRFAWHMMLRGKTCAVRYYATNPQTGQTMVVDLRPFLTQRQIAKLGKDPHMVHHLALYLKDEMQKDGLPNMEIRALDLVSLNGRKPQLLVDPRFDLGSQPRTWRSAEWLMPLETPLLSDGWDVPVVEWERHVDIREYVRGTPLQLSDESVSDL